MVRSDCAATCACLAPLSTRCAWLYLDSDCAVGGRAAGILCSSSGAEPVLWPASQRCNSLSFPPPCRMVKLHRLMRNNPSQSLRWAGGGVERRGGKRGRE